MTRPSFVHILAWNEYHDILKDPRVSQISKLNAAGSFLAASAICENRRVHNNTVLKLALVNPRHAKLTICDCDLAGKRNAKSIGRSVVATYSQPMNKPNSVTAVDFQSSPWYHGPNSPERRSLRRV
ncbi:hypothetical protein GTH32_18015 [Alteromonas sp. 345S023]|uniref:Uncharacterized protein n=1 Tax=Alteromonas profundi TaxID=2696062 RepID=A0A7X5LPA0_9ALTE|nr:hypothetical protein [Alteromonas profundi]NDV93067.1 hypothetical protein [Alteromonas profundi]